MSIPFFDNVLHSLGKKVNYDAVVNYAGNSFAKESWKMIQEANPLTKPPKIGTKFLEMLSGVKTVKAEKDKDGKVNLDKIDWSKV